MTTRTPIYLNGNDLQEFGSTDTIPSSAIPIIDVLTTLTISTSPIRLLAPKKFVITDANVLATSNISVRRAPSINVSGTNYEFEDDCEFDPLEIWIPDSSIIDGQFTIHIMKRDRQLIKGLVTVLYTIFNN
jgi:hypothetical protein